MVVDPHVVADRLDCRQEEFRLAAVAVNCHSRCVLSASTRMTEIWDPSGVTVGEYSLSGVAVTRTTSRRAMS